MTALDWKNPVGGLLLLRRMIAPSETLHLVAGCSADHKRKCYSRVVLHNVLHSADSCSYPEIGRGGGPGKHFSTVQLESYPPVWSDSVRRVAVQPTRPIEGTTSSRRPEGIR